MREFRDPAGVPWSVVRTTPHATPSNRDRILPEAYRLGWLLFESDRERRRLAPVPDNWEAMTDRELLQLCMAADVVPDRNERRAADMQQLLAKSLQEVCEQPEVDRLDTGELVRVEQTLSLAAKTAREAIALRRAERAAPGSS